MSTKDIEDQLAASIVHWSHHPEDWVKDKFPDIVLSMQQVNYLKELGLLIRSKIKAYDGLPMTEEEVRYSKYIGVSIMAGQGVGKDFMAGLTICFFLDVFPYPKITATGVTGKHLRNVLWSEIAKIMGMSMKMDASNPQSETVLEYVLQWQVEKVFRKGVKNEGSRWFAEAVTINPNSTEEDQAKTLYGRHEDFQLIVMDEAAGIPEPVFSPLEGTLTGKCCIALMIFNPTRASGYAYDSHYGTRSDLWLTMRWNAEESELVTKEHIEKMQRYGVDSNTYRVKVLGLPPHKDGGGMFAYESIIAAVDREFEVSEFDPVMCGVDAGGGGDSSVIAVRQGPNVIEIRDRSTSTAGELTDFATEVITANNGTVAFVDNIGLGWYLPEALRERNIDARAGDARSVLQLREPDRFVNKRAEMYWDLKLAFDNNAISIPNDEELINQLGAIRQENTGNRIKIMDKKEIRKKLGMSPDRADALALTYFSPDRLFRKKMGEKEIKRSSNWRTR